MTDTATQDVPTAVAEPLDSDGWESVTVGTAAEVDAALEWAAARGFPRRQVLGLKRGVYVVRWKRP